ncbi:hypothetical protein LJC48_07520 [Desulfovibrio sp. OttesenSCG-928-C06]|nr:hypothetical protein [Desulfovibrio sp. OttesenSCG-928-C06]
MYGAVATFSGKKGEAGYKLAERIKTHVSLAQGESDNARERKDNLNTAPARLSAMMFFDTERFAFAGNTFMNK